jgi:hypothetical protein
MYEPINLGTTGIHTIRPNPILNVRIYSLYIQILPLFYVQIRPQRPDPAPQFLDPVPYIRILYIPYVQIQSGNQLWGPFIDVRIRSLTSGSCFQR